MVRSFLIPFLVIWLFAVGVVSSEAAPDVFRLATDLDVNSEVAGDAVVLAGDLTLGPDAHVRGDAVAVLGRVHRDDRARVDGRVIALPSLAALSPETLGTGNSSTLRLGLFLLTGGLWLVATTFIAVFWPARLLSATAGFRQAGWRLVILGLVVVITLFAALVAVLGFGPVWGVPLAGCLMLVFLGFKTLGLAVLGAWIGSRLPFRWKPAGWSLGLDVFVGVSCLLVLRWVPMFGGTLWAIASVVALGVGVFSVLTEWSTSAKPVSIPLI
jgi:hypothetical protein